jgi:hypothetical protein
VRCGALWAFARKPATDSAQRQPVLSPPALRGAACHGIPQAAARAQVNSEGAVELGAPREWPRPLVEAATLADQVSTRSTIATRSPVSSLVLLGPS